ncbi:MAG: SMP-30/gluconolactonase/LRE family protein [Leifsonia sp.]
MRAANVTGPVAHHGEGPVWSESWGGLRFVDLTAGDLVTLEADGRSVRRLAIGSPVAAFVRPRADGGYIVATERGLGLSDLPDAPPARTVELWGDPGIRMNDGGTDPLGRLYAGSMSYAEKTGAASLYRIDAALGVTPVLDAVTISNGLAFSPDGTLCYYTDTPTGRIDVFDHVDGELVGRRPFVAIDSATGYPDGLTVDAAGRVWVALWSGSAVHAYGPDGSLEAVVELPVSQVSACTFGGDGLATLFITTSRQGFGPDDEPEAGSLFSVQPGAVGLPVVPFAG